MVMTHPTQRLEEPLMTNPTESEVMPSETEQTARAVSQQLVFPPPPSGPSPEAGAIEEIAEIGRMLSIYAEEPDENGQKSFNGCLIDSAALACDLKCIAEGMIGPPYNHDEDAEIVNRAIATIAAVPDRERRIAEQAAEIERLKRHIEVTAEVTRKVAKVREDGYAKSRADNAAMREAKPAPSSPRLRRTRMRDVVHIIDRLKDRSEAYSALKEIAQLNFASSEIWAEDVMYQLWIRGFKIVPRDWQNGG